MGDHSSHMAQSSNSTQTLQGASAEASDPDVNFEWVQPQQPDGLARASLAGGGLRMLHPSTGETVTIDDARVLAESDPFDQNMNYFGIVVYRNPRNVKTASNAMLLMPGDVILQEGGSVRKQWQNGDCGMGHGTLARILTGLPNDELRQKDMTCGGFAWKNGKLEWNSGACNFSGGGPKGGIGGTWHNKERPMSDAEQKFIETKVMPKWKSLAGVPAPPARVQPTPVQPVQPPRVQPTPVQPVQPPPVQPVPASFRVGDAVEHTTRGPGKVVDLDATLLHVKWDSEQTVFQYQLRNLNGTRVQKV